MQDLPPSDDRVEDTPQIKSILDVLITMAKNYDSLPNPK
jgi:hypothetical protein